MVVRSFENFCLRNQDKKLIDQKAIMIYHQRSPGRVVFLDRDDPNAQLHNRTGKQREV